MVIQPSIIDAAEAAIVQRLREGLGRMVREVGSYGGELDDDLPEVIRRFPAVWVTFGGVHKSVPRGTSREQWHCFGKYVVMLGERNLRSEEAGRRGGAHLEEPGAYRLIYAVRRLLACQDMGLAIEPLTPGKVSTLYNTRLNNQAFSVWACEFETAWIERVLDNGHWPAPASEAEPDAVFAAYQGRLEAPAGDWHTTALSYSLIPDGGAHAADILTQPEAQP